MIFQRRRIPAFPRSADSQNDHLLMRKLRCRIHDCTYPLNVMEAGRLVAGKCPECYPPKKPAQPEGSKQ